jgi:molecular chaperone DnaK
MRFGIDFGTTHTVVALVDRGNYPIVAFEQGDVIPSLIAASLEGELRFGHQAAQVAREPGWELLRSFKRLLNDAGPHTEVALAGRTFLLADLVARFLGHLRDELRASNAGLRADEPIEAAISVPANASSAQRLMTLDAYRRAGFEVKAVINEPSAAGFEYAHRFRETVTARREYVLVYDLGGGTFDASLIHMEGRRNEVVTSAGVSRLGGDDFDQAILGLVLEKLPPGAPRDRQALLDECRAQKEATNANTRKLVIDDVVLPADEVYARCAPFIDQTLVAMEPAMRDPRRGDAVDWNELAGIYVVGGASAFPPVYRQLRERFGTHRVRRSPHPFGSCAIGLAIFLDEAAGYRLTEKLTRHFGVFRESQGGERISFDVLVPKDSPLPFEVARRYRAAHNLGHYRFVECGRIEDGRPEGNLALWDEVLFPFDPALRGRPDLAGVTVRRMDGPLVEEQYRVTETGALEVQLRVLDDGYSATLQLARR